MALPQIGLEAILKVDKFIQNAGRYSQSVDKINKDTSKAARQMEADMARVSRAAKQMTADLINVRFDPKTSRFRDIASGQFVAGDEARRQIDAAMQASQNYVQGAERAISANAKLGTSFQQVAMTAGVVVGAIGLVVAAIKKLVDAGEQAAILEDMRTSFQSLAGSYGLSAREMVASLQEVSRGTISTSEIIRLSNQAMMAGGREFAETLPQLYQIAEAAARQSGKSTLDVMDSLVRGIAKGSPKLIDDAEVYLLISDSVEQYARSLNKTVDELTASQRQYATLQAVLNNYDEIMQRVGGTTSAAVDPFRRLTVQTEAYSAGVKTVLLPAATLLVEKLTKIVDASKKGFAAQAALLSTLKEVPKSLYFSAEGMDYFRSKYDEVLETLNTGMKPIEDTGTEIENIGRVSEVTARRIEEANKQIRDLDAEYQEKLAKIMLQDARRQDDMRRARDRQTIDDARNLGRRRADMEKSNARRREDMDLANARKREDIARENAKRLEDNTKDLNKKQRDFDREALLAREKLERLHQDRLAEIRRKAQDDISEAARRNDAVAIAKAMRERERDIREEKIDNQNKRRELEIDLAEKQRKIDEDAMESKQKAKEQADDRLAQQILNEQRQEEDFKIFLARQAEDERIYLERQASDRKLAWARQEEDRKISLQRQLDDLEAWYKKEQDALKKHLQELTTIAQGEILKGVGAISKTALKAMQELAGSTYGLTRAEQRQQRGTFLGAETTPPPPSYTESEQWRRRHQFFRAEGGMDIVNRPTRFVAGEAGPELAAFIPIRNNKLDIGGEVGVNVHGAGAGMDTAMMQALVYQAMVHVARRISTRGGR